ncbi:CaiB/BaiF CoA-transferase family protein [Microbacterium sp. No. 7]|uniref:CaiB/BaiF CoA-transferase family protein n=1 Tax=Microbacterium sp. No. 7 TaxID=1714373 RepID=UPI0006D0A4A6|nr:CoA transferase [Microbacterium sp. No. 7]ALJ19946.1 hypothetical protein AOA12_08510 [Microbacterium sp. No. 7]
MPTHLTYQPPLDGVRILDAVSGRNESLGAYLAELGADVTAVDLPRDDATGTDPLARAVRGSGKRRAVADPRTPAGRRAFEAMLVGADVFLVNLPAGVLDDWGYTAARLAEIAPQLVTLSVTDFGLTGPRAAWSATPDVLFALSGVLSRSGLPEIVEPLLPPEHLAYEAATMQAAWVVMLGVAHARQRGSGEYIDFSVLDAMTHLLDPGFGIGGSARAGAPMADLPRGRPDARHLYPTFPAKDGDVRICVLSPRQWQSMLDWLGRPEQLAGDRYDELTSRQQADAVIRPYYERLFAGLTRAEAVEAGTRHGVPIAAVLTAGEVLAEPAFAAAGTFRETELADGTRVPVPTGVLEIDDAKRAPTAPASDAPHPSPQDGSSVRGRRHRIRPFEGLRVLDLGVIVVGAELGRLFADYGADVIKIESRQFPDGSRQTYGGQLITEGFSWGHRNKRSLGLNLRTEEGMGIFRDLVAEADMVFSNFKPGTLEKLGIGYADLAALNPRIILTESSAFGRKGPWSGRMGYGPLVRASSALSRSWMYPGVPDSYSDAITIYPDHVAARAIAAGVVALLLRRERTGLGGHLSCAQIDVIFAGLAERFAAEHLHPGRIRAEGNRRGHDAPSGPYPARGDDEWVVVDVTDTRSFLSLARAMSRTDWLEDAVLHTPEGRLARAGELERAVTAWTGERDPERIEHELQSAGVACGRMLRVADLAADEHAAARELLGLLVQPQFEEPLPTFLSEARFSSGLSPLLRPAPLQGQHTEDIARDILGLDDAAIARLVAADVLQPYPVPAPTRS